MTLAEFLSELKRSPLVASVQASPGSGLGDADTLLKLARCSLSQGVYILRLEGVESIRLIQRETKATVIGLIKRRYDGQVHYITPTIREVDELLQTDCQVIALDARNLDGSDRLKPLVEQCHAAGRLVLADVERAQDVQLAIAAGSDMLSTTFARCEPGHGTFTQPDFGELRKVLFPAGSLPVLGEGGYQTEAHVRDALTIGACGVVVGGGLNDPVKTSARFVQAAGSVKASVGAVDIGGTRLRYGVFSPDWQLLSRSETPLPSTHAERLAWIEAQSAKSEVCRIGISTGGSVRPWDGTIYESKATIPDNLTGRYEIQGKVVRAMNDGLAAAWGHRCGLLRDISWPTPVTRTVTIAVGTGLGCGVTIGPGFITPEIYPRLNDISFEDGTLETALGGASLGENPSVESRERALRAITFAVDLCHKLYAPDVITLCGGVAFSPWFRDGVADLPVRYSLFGADAGLYGAAALALFPPIGVFPEADW